MPTTSSPWASPSSPAGRRLLQTEPATADDIPALDEATLALGAALVAASAAPPPPFPARRRTAAVRRRARFVPVAAALVVAGLAVGATAGLDDPAPVPSRPVAAVSPLALGRAAGSALGAAVDAPVPGGQVVVELIAPTQAVGVAPVAPAEPTLAQRLGHLVALAAGEPSVG